MFKEKKSREAISYLLKELGGQTEYFKLTKLLYFADRASIERQGRQITGDAIYALPHGPILSLILDRLNGSHKDFTDVVVNEGQYMVKLVKEEPPNYLSFSDVAILKEVLAEYGGLTWKQLREVSHKLPEWKKYDRGDETWSRISIQDVAEALGRSEEEIRSLVEHNQDTDEVSAVMASLGSQSLEPV